jgi:hypothetical protein
MNTAGWICFAAIPDKILFAYSETNNFDMNYLSFIFMVVFLPINPISTSIIEKYGLRKTLLIGAGI